MKTNTSLRKRFSSRGWSGPRENSVGANWRTSKPADKSGTERPRFLRRTVLLSTTLCLPLLSIFRLDRHGPPPAAAETSRDCKKISPVNQLFSSFLLVCCPPAVLCDSLGMGPKSHHITKLNVTKLRRRETTVSPLALVVYRGTNIRAAFQCMGGRICRNRACYERFVCCWNRKRIWNGISVSASCLIHQNRSNLLVVVIVGWAN